MKSDNTSMSNSGDSDSPLDEQPATLKDRGAAWRVRYRLNDKANLDFIVCRGVKGLYYRL